MPDTTRALIRWMTDAGRLIVVGLGAGLLTLIGPAMGQQASKTSDDQPSGAEANDEADEQADMVRLNLPENVKLSVLIDYVSERKQINFLYDKQQLRQHQITLKTPTRIPADSLMPLLRNVLKMKGMRISSTDVAGMMRIEQANQPLSKISRGPEPAETDTPEADGGEAEPPAQDDQQPQTPPGDKDGPVTRVFTLRHAKAQQLQQTLQPFLSASHASATPLPAHGRLIVTDVASNMPRIRKLISLIDRQGKEVTTRFVKIKHMKAQTVSQKVTQILRGRAKARNPGKGGEPAVTVVATEQTNQVALVGPPDAVEAAVETVKAFDKPGGLTTRIYEFEMVSAGQIDQLVIDSLSDFRAERFYRAAVAEDANLLIVSATKPIHQKIDQLCKRLDQPVAKQRNPVRFYELKNAKAKDVLNTLRNLQGRQGGGSLSVDGVSGDGASPAAQPRTTQGGIDRTDQAKRLATRDKQTSQRKAGDPTPGQAAGDAQATGAVASVRGARLMAHEPTNTIIVVARASMHPVYKKLINRLDVRRPQVLVKATVVSLDTTDNFSLGVEIFSGESADDGQLLNFTQFGLTSDDSSPGNVTLTAPTGLNSALLDAATAEVVVNALQEDSRARIVSRPSVLINDNAKGQLVSEREEPFVSVNTGQTDVTTQSLGGFATAGTEITITPQISEGNHLKLDYDIQLSTFDEERLSETLPPGRQTDSLESEVTIPNGHTIVVGGLTRNSLSNTKRAVPILGDIPIIEYAFSDRSTDRREQTLFVFLHAKILRDDKFRDLKILSDKAQSQSGVADGFPKSQPVTVK